MSPEPIVVTSRIERVTVYPDRARVTCVGEVPVTTGALNLIFDDLPLTLDVDSLRVAGHGTARVRLLSVELQRHHYIETPATAVRDLLRAIESAEEEQRAAADRASALQAHLDYLAGLRSETEQYAKALAWGRTTIEDQSRVGRHLLDEDERVRSDMRTVAAQQRDINLRLDQLRRELKEVQTQRPRQRYRAVIDAEALGDGTFTPELTYVVGRAGWQPLYDLRLREGDNGPQLEVNYLAQITQSTGEDWRGVALRVSTARPALNQRLPELTPWFIDQRQPTPPIRPMAAKMVRSAEMDMAAAMPEAAGALAADVAVAAVEDTGLAATFVLPGRPDVPSDGSPHKVTINQFSLPARLDYFSVPKHTDAVFRRATVTNDSATPLMAGAATLFAGDEFIGRTRLEFTPGGGEIELLLGVEERITVERELVRRDVDKRFIGDRRVLRYGYKIAVHNLLTRAAQLSVEDQIPVARHEQIKVKLERVVPDSAEKTDLNLLKWRFTLEPGAKTTLLFDFSVEHPRSLEVSGLMD